MKAIVALFISSIISIEAEKYEHAYNEVTGCFTADNNKCYLDLFKTSSHVEMETYESCNHKDSKGNTYCLEKETTKTWIEKHPLVNEVDENGCFKSDDNMCYIFATEWD